MSTGCLKIDNYLDLHLNFRDRYKAWLLQKQYSCEIELTNRCNWHCKYCYIGAGAGGKTVHEAPFLKSILLKLDDAGIDEIGWIGGEPLMYRDIFVLMDYAKMMGLSNALYTNGSLITSKNVDSIVRLVSRIIIHVDAVNFEGFAEGQLKVNKAHFSSNMAAVPLLVSAGFPVRKIMVSIPLTRKCYENLEETMVFYAHKGVDYFNLIPLTSLGRAGEEIKDFISKEELKKAFELRSKILRYPFLEEMGISEYGKWFQLTDFTINWKGDIVPYIDYFRPVGNIYDRDLKDILLSEMRDINLSRFVSADGLKNTLEGECGSCEFSRHCFGNPVSRADNYGKSDRDCWLVK